MDLRTLYPNPRQTGLGLDLGTYSVLILLLNDLQNDPYDNYTMEKVRESNKQRD